MDPLLTTIIVGILAYVAGFVTCLWIWGASAIKDRRRHRV